MKEHSNDRDKAEQSAHQRKNRGKGRAKRVWGVIGTIVLVGVLTMAIFVGIFMTYINKSLKGHVVVDMSSMAMVASCKYLGMSPISTQMRFSSLNSV